MRLLLTALLLSRWAVSFSQCPDAPDLIITHANIITMNPAQPAATALAIQNGNIIAIRTEADMIAIMPENCPVKWIDAIGYTILPGFNDAHAHWLSWPEHICDAPGQEETTYPPLNVIMDSISKHGWTSISELNFGRPALIPEHLQHALELEADGDLNVRLNGYWGTYDALDLLDELDVYGYAPGHAFSERIRVPGVKIYVDDPFGTMDIMDQNTCTALVMAAHAAGYQVAAHCVNESAVEKIVTAYETALGNAGNGTIRHRIEHAVKVNDDQLNRIENKDILLSFQLLGPPDWPEQNTFQTYLSNANTPYLLRWKDFIESGTPVTGSTDAPFNNSVCDYSPFRAIYQAVTRKGYIDRTHAAWELNQRISIANGLKLLTVDGAFATGEENVKGSLMTAKYADLTIISQDPLSLQDPADLLTINTLLTMVDGEIEYCDVNIPAFCDPSTAFRIDTQVLIVSHFLEGQPAGLAFDLDNESSWVSGGYPPQFLEIDLLKNTSLDRIELVVEQFPSGFTRHQLSGAGEGQMMQAIHQFAGTTSADDILSFQFQSPNDNFQKLRITTLESPSWVAWKEIRLIRSGTTFTPPLSNPVLGWKLYPNPANRSISISLYLGESLHQLVLSVKTIDGTLIRSKYVGDLSEGVQHLDMELMEGMPNGTYLLQLTSTSMISIFRFTTH